MQYYQKYTERIFAVMPYHSAETLCGCRDYGLWPLYDAPFTEDLRYFTRQPAAIEYNENSDTYTQTWMPVLLPLDAVRYAKRQDFENLLAEFDDRRAAAVAMITECTALGLPREDYAEDLQTLGRINMIAAEIHLMLAELDALTIPDGATPEAVRAVAQKAMDMQLWLPPELWAGVGREQGEKLITIL